MFYGVAEGGTGHGGGMLVEKVEQELAVAAFAQFTERPANSLVHKVVLVVQKQLRQFK